MSCCDPSAPMPRPDATSAGENSASLEKFLAFDKIDAHIHNNVENSVMVQQAKADGFRIHSINADVSIEGWMEQDEQFDIACKTSTRDAKRFFYSGAFTLDGWDNDDWADKTIAALQAKVDRGAAGFKVWKNIGMEFKDKEGKFVMVDHPKLDPVFKWMEDNSVTLVGHCGEPRNCWLPLEQMSTNNDRGYFAGHPQFHMYLHPEFPSYEDQINSRDNMLRKHPKLHFMGAHLASLEWSVDELAKRLDEFPLLSVDFAHRMGHVQVQVQEDRDKVVAFFVKYQDRLVYGTDLQMHPGDDLDKVRETMHSVWTNDWQFLSTEDTMTAPDVNGTFRGLALPDDILAKLYRTNAEKWFPRLKTA